MAIGVEIFEQPIRIIIESDFWGILLTIGLIVATFLGAGATWYMAHLHKQQQKFENDREGMIHVFGLLSNETNRKMRLNVYVLFTKDKGFREDGEIEEEDNKIYENDVQNSRTVFGQIGRLVQEKYVPKEIFLKTYSGIVIKVWKALEKNIERERKIRKMSKYMESFEYLFKESSKFWKDNYPNEPFPDPAGAKTQEEMG